MKKLFALLALVASFVMVSCDKADGDWPAIKVNKERASFSKDGGKETIKVKNYDSWWISSACDKTAQTEEQAHISPTYVEGEDGQNQQVLEGGWFGVVLENKTSAVIMVSANDTGAPRQAALEMTVGDAFKTITIYQE